MKKIAYIAGVALIGVGALTSCTLDAINYVEKTPDNFPVTADEATQGLAGIYENLNQVNATPQQSFFYLSMLASDDNLGGGGKNDKLMQAMDLMLNYQNDMTRQFWTDRYQGINRANSLLAGIPNIQLSENERNQIEGEAKFLRAFFYYELCSQYGPVPLVLTTDEVVPSQTTAAQCWGQILQDLRDAAANMPATRRTDGHVDKYTAEAMLGRAWLFYTGMYCNGEDLSALTSTSYNPLTEVALPDGTTLTKQEVIGYLDDCVENSGYDLVPDYRNLWAYTNKYTVEDYDYTAGQGLKWVEDDSAVNPETLFAIKFNKLASWSTTIGYANGYALHFAIRNQSYEATFPFGTGWGAGPVAPNLYTDWQAAEPTDMRREASIQLVRELPNYVYGGAGDWVQETDYYQKKQLSITARYTADDGTVQYAPVFDQLMYGETGWQNPGGLLQTGNIHDMVLIRFADVLLMQSELKEDVSGINRVRNRAGLEPIGAYSLQALQNERRWELAFEGVRWNDIRRWHIAAQALEKQTNQAIYLDGVPSQNTAHAGGYAARYNATAGFAKIPDTEISLANGALTQNPGWAGADSEYNAW